MYYFLIIINYFSVYRLRKKVILPVDGELEVATRCEAAGLPGAKAGAFHRAIAAFQMATGAGFVAFRPYREVVS